MATIFGLFDLKDGVDPEEYERWARMRYGPVVRDMPSIDHWQALRASGTFGANAAPPYRYFLVIEVNDLEGVGRDLTDDRMQTLLAELHEFADPPTLVVTERFA